MPKITFLSTAHIHSEHFLKTVTETCGAPHAIWDDHPDRGRHYAEQFGCTFVADIESAVHDTAVDGFVVCSENTRHLPLLERALPIGKPVMCEKPIVTGAADAMRVAALVKEFHTPLTTGYFQPFSGANRAIMAKIDNGELGKVLRAKFRNAHHAAFGRWFDDEKLAWFHDPELAGGGALMDMGTHALHLLLHMFGEVDSVFGYTANMSGEYPEVDDYGLIHLKFSNGVLGTVEGGWTQVSGQNGIEISGSDGTIWQQNDTLVHGKLKETPAPVAPIEDRPSRIHRLLAVIAGDLSEDELQQDLTASLNAAVVMEAAYASAKSGTWQPVPKL